MNSLYRPSLSSVERIILNGAKLASNVPPRERKAKRAEKVATRSVLILPTLCSYADWTY